MTKNEKINYLKENHFSEWLNIYRKVEDEFSEKQSMFCICGKLATGLHERNCRKFRNKIEAETVNRLKYLITKEETVS